MMVVAKKDRVPQDEVLASYERNAGNIRATAKELGISRSSVRRKLAPLGKLDKPIAAGSEEGTKSVKRALPKKGEVRRYILTSAQNNTLLHVSAWANLLSLAEYYRAEIIVGTFTYNQNAYGKLSVKRGKEAEKETELWYDPQLIEYIRDERIELAPGLVWCGEMNILPTAVNPLAGLESYTGRASAIFPHAKLAMRSIATTQGEGTKLNYTTGTVTQRNYIQKREGVIAEFHHIYGGLLVEVNSDGNWWVRQLNEDEKGTIQDLGVLVKDGKVIEDVRVEAITFGDLHGTFADPVIVKASLDMLDTLQPKYQFLHDVLEGVSINPHTRKCNDNHTKFHTYLRGYSQLGAELRDTVALLSSYTRKFASTVIVDSNHDDAWIQKWLREYDYRKDPANAELFLSLQEFMYQEIRSGKMPRDVSVIEFAMRNLGYKAKFLRPDESFLTCNRKIENGQHGHLGPGGRFGTPENLSKMARKANTCHTHACGIYSGLYVGGTSSKLRWDYAKGPSNWSNTHIITYSNGKRSLVTIYNGAWRA
jgi:Bacterial regulatory protein, Fis family